MDYQCVQFQQPGDVDVLQIGSVPRQRPTDQQVLIQVAYAGVNGPDIAQRRGLYPAPKGASSILGLEVSGTVVAVGDKVSLWQVGQQVCALVPGGGYAEYVLTHAEHCLPIPQGLTLQQAACLPETFFTVWGNLFMRAKLVADETVLIHGGSGGIGSSAIVLAKALGAKVIVTARGEDKCAHCERLGADHVINSEQACFVDAVMLATQGNGVDVVLDMVGGDYINRNLKCLSVDGRMMSIAMQQAPRANVDIFRLMAKRISWSGSTLRPQSDDAKAEIAQSLQRSVWPLFAKNSQLTPVIFAEFSLADCAQAHQVLEAGSHCGKVVLKVGMEHHAVDS